MERKRRCCGGLRLTGTLPLAAAQDGSAVPINRPVACIGSMFVLNALAPAHYTLFAYNALAALSAPEVTGTYGFLTQPIGAGGWVGVRAADMACQMRAGAWLGLDWLDAWDGPRLYGPALKWS